MPWVRIDDHFNEHPKLAAAGPLAWALWLAGLAYCNRNLTDGFIPWATAGSLVSWDYLDALGPCRIYIGGLDGVSEEGVVTSDYVIGLLVEGGLWTDGPGGYRVHNYAEYQPTRAQVEAERLARVAAGRAGGLAAAIARAKAPAVAHGVAQSKPVPNPKPVPHVDTQPSTVDTQPSTKAATTPRQIVHRWLTDHGTSLPVGWANASLNELVKVFGAEAVIATWDGTPGLRTVNQHVRHAERALAPIANQPTKPASGRTRTAQEGTDAFNR